MKSERHILVVDDDAHIRDVVCFTLEKAGYRVSQAVNGEEALKKAHSLSPDLMVLDVLMPELDGTEVCRELRKTSDMPIVFLSSRDEEIDRIIGLELGGDDYITKPFSPRELLARIKAVLRRLKRQPSSEPKRNAVIHHGRLRLDTERYEIAWDGQNVVLTASEYGLVRSLLNRPGKVYARSELMSDVVVSDRTIDSHIRRIRAKFAQFNATVIETVHGLGYKIGPCQ